MENGTPYYKENLQSQLPISKSDKKQRSKSSSSSKSSVPSIFLAFFSCLAWLYIAGR